ncbi:MAG: hypothetical protein RLY86_19 [Pseudomonadota bacterium]|jgi:peptidoglycan/LPS O-acetylase OafA/YrhL
MPLGDATGGHGHEPSTPTAPPTPAERLPTLDALRGIAALAIVIYHFQHFGPWFDLSWLGGTGLLHRSYLWVDLFFILSGYVLAHVYAGRIGTAAGPDGRDRRRAIQAFWVARIAKLYPLHLTALLMIAALAASGLVEGDDPREGRCYGGGNLVASLLLVQAWGTTGGLCWNVPSWSISAEMGAYFLFPLLLPLVRRLERPLFLLLPLPLIGLLVWLVEGPGGGRLSLHYDFGMVRCLPSFILGLWLQRLCGGQGAGPGARPGAGAGPIRCLTGDGGCLAVLAALLVSLHVQAHDALSVAVMGVLVGCVAVNRGRVRRLSATRLPLWLGAISYAVYLLHWPLLLATHGLLGHLFPDQAGWPPGRGSEMGLYAAYLTLLLALATLCHHRLEGPARRWLRRRLGGEDDRRPTGHGACQTPPPAPKRSATVSARRTPIKP